MRFSATRTNLLGHALGAFALLCLAFLGFLAARPEDKPKPLIFCAAADAMPRTGKEANDTPKGLDFAVARLICQKLGRPLESHWCANAACARRCLREKRCDVILGHPLDEGAPKDIAWSVPYAGSMFGLVIPAEAKGVRSLADLIDRRVGLVAGTVALPENKHTLVRFRTREEALEQFASQKLDAAFLDSDFAAWHLHAHPKLPLRLVGDYVPREHWNMALAVRAENAPLLVQINKALAELAESGELRKAYDALGVPYRPPFTGSAASQPRSIPGSASRNAAKSGSRWTPPTCPIPAPRKIVRALTWSWPARWLA